MNRISRKLMNRELIEVATLTGLTYDRHAGVAFGNRNGYEMIVTRIANRLIEVLVSVKFKEEESSVNLIKTFVQNQREVSSYSIDGHKITFLIRTSEDKDQRIVEVLGAIESITAFFNKNGYENCCQKCGNTGEIESCMILRTKNFCCSSCFEKADKQSDALRIKKENIFTGILGALIGGAIALLLILKVSEKGYADLSTSLILSFLTLFGYKLFGRKLTKKGIAISIIIIVAVSFVAYQIFQTRDIIYIINEYPYRDMDWVGTFKNVIPILEEFDEFYKPGNIMDLYYLGLIRFCVLNVSMAIPTSIGIVWTNKKKIGNITYKMSRNKVV